MKLVISSGEVIEVNENYQNLMKAARVSLGMLGVIAEIELQAVKMKWINNIRIDLTLKDFLYHQNSIFERYEHVWAHWLLGTEKNNTAMLGDKRVP